MYQDSHVKDKTVARPSPSYKDIRIHRIMRFNGLETVTGLIQEVFSRKYSFYHDDSLIIFIPHLN